VRRGETARDLVQRDVEALWEEGLVRAGVPVAMAGTGRGRPRIVFAAPVPVGVTADREPIDLFLAARLTIADLRAMLLAALPPGHGLVDLHDVWIGEPSIAGRVVAADYRVEVSVDPTALASAVAALLAAPSLDRPRRKSEDGRTYDLRPLIAGLEARATDGGSAILRMRLRHDPARGTGRPDEVLAVLAARLGAEPRVGAVCRERLWLAGERDEGTTIGR
jgi:radical SAM-linked protein